jgi:MFS family permease
MPVKKNYIGWSLLLSSISFLIYGIYILMTGLSNPAFAIWFFLIAFAWACCVSALYLPPNFSLLFKIVPSEKLGQLLGIMWAIQFGGIFLSGFVISGVNKSFAAPTNFGIFFILTFVINLFSVLVMFKIKEPKGADTPSVPSFGAYIVKLINILKTDRLLVKFLVGKWLMSGHYIMMAFILAFLINERGFNTANAGWFAPLNSLGLAIAGFTITKIADVYGPKYLLITSQIIAAIYTLMVLLIPTLDPIIVFGIFIITGLAQMSDNVGYTNMCLFCCPTIDKSTYVAVTNVGIIPFMVILPIVMGLLIDNGILTYMSTFGIALAMMIVATLYILFFLENPKAFMELRAASKK